ncbi:flagellin, partial [Porticoccaceae bacterium]|nr:flagellin [Porticoccaceae bacterium]
TQTGYVTHASAVPTLTQTTAPTVSGHTLNSTGTWSQRGSDIDGEAAGDESGYAVTISEDGNTIVIGAPDNYSGGSRNGHVRIYDWNSTTWVQRGSDIDGESHGGKSGSAISLSRDKNTLVIGARFAVGGAFGSGNARVFDWNGTNWIQRGANIDGGEGFGDQFGDAVSISEDGNVIAVGAWSNDGNGANSGNVEVYEWNGSSWFQRGSDIDGEAAYDHSGKSVSLSGDGDILAIGAMYNDGNGSTSGSVRVYTWNGSAWAQRGTDIDGEANGDRAGKSVSISDDGNTLAISVEGHVRLYTWNGSAWVKIGADIDVAAAEVVNLSKDGSRVSIGASSSNNSTGMVQIYEWNGSAWVQQGSDINGEATGDYSGQSISLDATGRSIVIGAHKNDNNMSTNAGHARVYDWPSTSTYNAGGSKLDFNNLNLVTGDRITINAAGGTQVQGIIGADGLDALLASMASQIAAQTGLYGGASASSGVISITGLADGNSVSGLTVTLETDANSYSDSVSPSAITSAASATTSLAIIDRAMTQINSQRGNYGAVMNRLEYAIDNLATMSTNVKASLSRIQDADYAKETTELARTQIIQQAATAMLAQANQQAKVVMDILNWDK